jgi:hypothetical protein
MKSKLIEYAYPSSIKAKKAGFEKTGCWYIGLYPSIDSLFGGEDVPGSYSTDKQQVIRMAKTMPNPFNKNSDQG